MKRWLAVAAALGLAGPASAQDWFQASSCTGTAQRRISPTDPISPRIHHCPTSTGRSETFVVEAGLVTVEFNGHSGGTGNSEGVEVELLRCNPPPSSGVTCSTSLCRPLCFDNDLDGVRECGEGLNGDQGCGPDETCGNGDDTGVQRRWYWNVPPGVYCINTKTAPTTQTPVVTVEQAGE